MKAFEKSHKPPLKKGMWLFDGYALCGLVLSRSLRHAAMWGFEVRPGALLDQFSRELHVASLSIRGSPTTDVLRKVGDILRADPHALNLLCRGFQKTGAPFGSPWNADHGILESTFGAPISGNTYFASGYPRLGLQHPVQTSMKGV